MAGALPEDLSGGSGWGPVDGPGSGSVRIFFDWPGAIVVVEAKRACVGFARRREELVEFTDFFEALGDDRVF